MRSSKRSRGASSTPLVLAILAERESYGYAIIKPSLSRNQEKEIKNGFQAPGLKAVKVQLRNRTTTVGDGKAIAESDQWMIYTYSGKRQPPQMSSVQILLAKGSRGNWGHKSGQGQVSHITVVTPQPRGAT